MNREASWIRRGGRRLKALLAPPPGGNEGTAFHDVTADEWRIINRCKPFTMTSTERLVTAMRAVDYIVQHRIPGDIVECGVWRGGSSMAMALTLAGRGDTSRNLYLYDTFEGMTAPGGDDLDLEGGTAEEVMARDPVNFKCVASFEDVKRNIRSTGYPASRIHMVKGPVEDTIPGTIPPAVAILRLDTDWYESTRHEMQHLYPLLTVSGIIIIDDYGHWKGARKAVDEYVAGHGVRLFLSRIDYTGRIGIKQG